MQCAIFCNVIDNFGDIGVCWRLARQLADEYNWQVSLFVDDLDSFAVLAPSLLTTLDVQPLDRIIVRRWHAQVLFEQAFDLVIEGFGCRLSDGLIAQLQAQAQAGQPALWLNLEYLSAEAWAIDCHGMTSIHPSTGLQQTFWFPSVTPQSGGLLREQNLIQQRDQFQQDYHQQAQQQAQFWHSLSVPDAMRFDRKISLFSYQNNQIAELLNVLAADHQSTLLLVPYSKSIPDIQNWLAQADLGQDVAIHRVHTLHNVHTLQIGARITRNNLSIAVLPFLSHQQYDQLLWACDVNFVRGEDSCVRAQWAGKPFIWHIYPQEEQAHLVKLQAWLDQMALETEPVATWQAVMQNWNSAEQADPSIQAKSIWAQWLEDLPRCEQQMAQWTGFLVQQSSLAQRLNDYFLSRKVSK